MLDKEIFRDVKYYVADLDGTVYLGNDLIDGAKDFFRLVRENGKDFYFLTNNSYQKYNANTNLLFLYKRGNKVFLICSL